ncbi:MAG TPA: 5'-3' exonuclease H3TH domain-containing protein, partial [Anaerovoracaceae bacterium]|nr:5'-3' exonuclease H3TH domain-containing protein [Anaerovoracaceae bacterium]
MKIIIIDGNSLINRAYYALQRPMITKNGLYTQGVYGFLNMLNKINTDYKPDYITVAFDRKAPTFRHLEYADYKAGRKKMPPELAMQLPLLKEVLDAMKVKMLEIDGFEADDIIGTVAKRAEMEGLEPLIISGDKDELQLATERTKVLITKKGISEFDLYDEAAMFEKYGFSPEQFIDFKGLMGDPSDNIPGIPGVGEKTALKLVQEFGSIANLIANVDQVTSKTLKEKIEENAQLAIMSRRLATINTEVPIEINFEEFKAEEPDYDALIDLYIKLEFNSFLKKLQPQRLAKTGSSMSGAKGAPANGTAADQFAADQSDVKKELADYSLTGEKNGSYQIAGAKDRGSLKQVLISRENELELLREDLKEDQNIILKVFNDHNHKEIPLIYGINILSTNSSYFIKTEDTDLLQHIGAIILREGIRISGHNLKDDYYALMANGVSDPSSAAKPDSIFDTEFDTVIAQYLVDPSRSDYSLRSMMLEYFHEDMEAESSFLNDNGQIGFLTQSEQKYMDYGMKWCVSVENLINVLSHKLTHEELDAVFYEVELPLIEVLASMECCGFAVDRKELTDAGAVIGEKLNELSAKIYE